MRSTRLVGRGEELDQLRRAAELAREGRPTFRLVEGEAGIGKTRLVTDAISAFTQPGDVVAVGHSVAVGGSTLPYGVAADLVRDLIRQVGAGQVLAGDGAALTALTAAQADGSVCPRTLPAIASGLVAVVERLARERLLCLVFEDLHWSDGSSRELIDHLLRGTRACDLLVLCTRRTHDSPVPPALQQFVAELVRHPHADRLTLRRLDDGQVAEQVAGILGDRQPPPQLDRIVALGQGNPYLTEELVSARAGVAPVGDVMLARVDVLSPAARQLVHAAAVGDGHLWHPLLARVSGLAEPAVDVAATEVVASFVLEPEANQDRYMFRHALLREAVARRLLPAERKRWHQRWAEALEIDPGPIPTATAQIAIAHHGAQTDDVLRAFDAAVAAVEAAESIQASPEAAVQCQRLLELWPRAPDATRGLFSRLDYAWTALGHLCGSGQWAAALALADRELVHPEARENRVWRIRLEQLRSVAAEQTGSRVLGAADVEADVEALLAAPADNLLTQALLHYGRGLRDQGRLGDAQRLFERAVEVSAIMTEPDLLATRPPQGVMTAMRERWGVEVVLASQDLATGQEERALQRLSRLQPAARSAGLEGLGPRTDYAWLLQLTGRHREAVDVARETIEVIEHPRFNRAAWIGALAPLLDALFALGQWDEVQEWLDRAADVRSAGVGAHDEVAFSTARLSLCRGDLDHARAAACSLRRSTNDEAGGAGGPDCWRHWLQAEIAAAAGGEDAVARTELDAVWAGLGWREMHLDVCWQPLLLAARLEADRPGIDTAERVAAVRALATQMHKAGDLGVAWSTYLEAELLRVEGSRDPEPWKAAAAAWARIGQVHAEGWALVRQAACQVAVGSRPAAGEALARAHGTASRLGAGPLLDAVTGLARRARIDIGLEPAERGSSPLTGREIEVLRLIARGRSNSQIASELFISPKTASAHLSHIFTKLGVHTRTEAATVAMRHHLLDDTD